WTCERVAYGYAEGPLCPSRPGTRCWLASVNVCRPRGHAGRGYFGLASWAIGKTHRRGPGPGRGGRSCKASSAWTCMGDLDLWVMGIGDQVGEARLLRHTGLVVGTRDACPLSE
ncbi:unnamed protein product, partial [Dovyalis caffra]